jgi:hypothetical protein
MLTTLRAAGFNGPCLVELVGGSTPEETEHEARRALAHVQDIIVPPAAGGAGSGGRLHCLMKVPVWHYADGVGVA